MNTLLDIMRNAERGQFAHIVYLSDVELYGGKKNPLVGRVTKMVDNNVYLNCNYAKAVNAHLKKLGLKPDFKEDKLPWGCWLILNKVIEYKGNYYLRYYEKRNSTPKVLGYYVDNRPATDDELADIKSTMKPTKSHSVKQEESGLDDEEQVYAKNVKFVNVVSLNVDNVRYVSQEPRIASIAV